MIPALPAWLVEAQLLSENQFQWGWVPQRLEVPHDNNQVLRERLLKYPASLRFLQRVRHTLSQVGKKMDRHHQNLVGVGSSFGSWVSLMIWENSSPSVGN